ncbi:vacuolar proton-translocating ATPase [Cyclospora cayetanensis]|uniref:V-type proton ATPase subunit a n=1 Tax=Cyclospora cayetanensis TaxID=88456 RepID=A0A1D3CRN2_9EIME|nr:vacuolar proton-translocating ATPase [Cyclospora cayetanensis]
MCRYEEGAGEVMGAAQLALECFFANREEGNGVYSVLWLQPMRHGTLVLPQEGAKDFITAIGSKVQVQIQDMNGNSLSRAYRRQLQRLEELERMLRYLVQQIESIAEVHVEATGGVASVAPDAAVATKPQVYMLDRVEDMLNKVYGQFLRFAQNNKDLQREKSAAVKKRRLSWIDGCFFSCLCCWLLS